jgi:hypothetical protein
LFFSFSTEVVEGYVVGMFVTKMRILGHISGCTASLKPKERCIRREIAGHAVIAQDGPETALCQSPITADAAVLEVAALLCVLNQLHF